MTARLRVTRDTATFWRALEAGVRQHLPRERSFARIVCDCFWQAWKHLVPAHIAYARIYARDRQRCTSPVCSRRDVTPHHVQFRSHGGSDEDENLTSLCTFCHLSGVHQGRMKVSGRTPDLRWEIGRSATMVVEGRTMLS